MSPGLEQGGLGVLAAPLNYCIINDVHIPNRCDGHFNGRNIWRGATRGEMSLKRTRGQVLGQALCTLAVIYISPLSVVTAQSRWGTIKDVM